MEGIENQSGKWSKGLTKDNDVRLAQMSASIKKAHAAGRYKNRAYNGRKPMSDETKQKISKARIAYLKENPDKVPYLLNHSSKESYPEKYFTQVFANEGLAVEKEFRVALYSLDFAIPDRKIDIEIDGQQHYTDAVVMASDKRRTEYLEAEGWTIIRVDWGKYKRLGDAGKRAYVIDLIAYLNGLLSALPMVPNVMSNKIRAKGVCAECQGETCHKKRTLCRICYKKSIRKVERPTYESLMTDLELIPYTTLARKYSVSDNCIRKWIKGYEKERAVS